MQYLTLAHVKWFVDSPDLTLISPPPTWLAVLTIALSLVVVGLLAGMQIRLPEKGGSGKDGAILPLLQASLAVALIGASLNRYLLVPNLSISLELLIAQGIVGLLLIVDRRAALGLLGLMCFVPPAELPEHAELLGLPILLLTGSEHKPTSGLGFSIARVSLGASLITLAFTEKLLYPELALTFLQHHQWNILSPLGLSDTAFVFLIGCTELVLGLLLVLNIYPRTTGGAILATMCVTGALLGGVELLGHLPIMVLAYGLWIRQDVNIQLTQDLYRPK